jgi:hypothetical protein
LAVVVRFNHLISQQFSTRDEEVHMVIKGYTIRTDASSLESTANSLVNTNKPCTERFETVAIVNPSASHTHARIQALLVQHGHSCQRNMIELRVCVHGLLPSTLKACLLAHTAKRRHVMRSHTHRSHTARPLCTHLMRIACIPSTLKRAHICSHSHHRGRDGEATHSLCTCTHNTHTHTACART